MNGSAFWKYYRDLNLFNVLISVLSGIFFSVYSALAVFCSFGILIGYWGFGYFKANEYYMYYNLGYSKKSLLKKVFFVNLLVALPVLFILILFL